MHILRNCSCRRYFSQYWDSLPTLKLFFSHGRPNYGCLHHEFITQRCLAAASCNRAFASVPAVKSQVQKMKIAASGQNSFVCEIVLDIKNNRKDLESKLTKMAPGMSVRTITKIFQALNSQRVLGSRLFNWFRSNSPNLRRNARFCSLMVDNFGRLDDYENMLLILKELASENICLTSEAFGYLPVFASGESSLTESIERAVNMLNRVKGSCRNSGVCALVEMFSKLNLFELAKYVVTITERKEAYFILMIREKCKRNLVEDAVGLIKEMEASGISPRIYAYNYILGSLCKRNRADEVAALLKSMKETHIQPDGITMEILITSACRLGTFSNVQNLLDQMASEGIEPRLETHLRIIRAMFEKEDYEVAHKHVVNSCLVYNRGSNTMYSLLAKLLLKRGDAAKGSELLVEMMEKGLKPDSHTYSKIVRKLKQVQREDLAMTIHSLYTRV